MNADNPARTVRRRSVARIRRAAGVVFAVHLVVLVVGAPLAYVQLGLASLQNYGRWQHVTLHLEEVTSQGREDIQQHVAAAAPGLSDGRDGSQWMAEGLRQMAGVLFFAGVVLVLEMVALSGALWWWLSRQPDHEAHATAEDPSQTAGAIDAGA